MERVGIPTAASEGSTLERTEIRSFRIMQRLLGIILPHPITTPFPYVATHVIQAQLVVTFLFDRMQTLVVTLFRPSHFVQFVTPRIDIATAFVASTGSKLPLRFSRKAELKLSHLIQPLDEILTLIPIDSNGRKVVLPHNKSVVVIAHHGTPKALRHYGLPNIVTVQGDLMYRTSILVGQWMVVFAIRVFVLRTHQECATLHLDHPEWRRVKVHDDRIALVLHKRLALKVQLFTYFFTYIVFHRGGNYFRAKIRIKRTDRKCIFERHMQQTFTIEIDEF